MVEKINRTYRMDPKVDDWVEKFANEAGADKSEIVNRAVKVYAAKRASGDWKDPKYRDSIDKQMDKL